MILGFTGTREGLTCEQHKSVVAWLRSQDNITEFHHGCCIGADDELVDCISFIFRNSQIIAHVPANKSHMSLVSKMFSKCLAPLPYLRRNHAIVDSCDHLLACPKGDEELRSGTWATVRYARKQKKPITIIWPDGSIES